MQKNTQIFSQISTFVFVAFLVFYYSQPFKPNKTEIDSIQHSISFLRSAIIMDASQAEIDGQFADLERKVRKIKIKNVGLSFEKLTNYLKTKNKKASVLLLNEFENEILR